MNIRTWQELKALSNNQWSDDECMKEEIAQLRAELLTIHINNESYQKLINLLCRIHRDGGHYITEHGIEKAFKDADIIVAQLNAKHDELKTQEIVHIIDNADWPDADTGFSKLTF